ncbi:MAG TPA: hypothetical protein VFG51_02655 [Candidatus Saccharimonadia bacterium]|nr:hypothetical protein [Candidatus Saccharimonadia bacterium]
MPEQPSKESYGYGKRPMWQWVLIYVVIGGILYAVAYYVFFAKRGYSPNAPASGTQQTQPLTY